MYPARMNLACAHCGQINADVWVDGDTVTRSFRCEHCGGQNIVATVFKTIAPEALQGESSPLWEKAVALLNYRRDGEDIPFFSETVLYDLIGKEDARSVLMHVRRLLEAGGITMREVPLHDRYSIT